jgi:hypothetical protein
MQVLKTIRMKVFSYFKTVIFILIDKGITESLLVQVPLLFDMSEFKSLVESPPNLH